MNTQKIEERLRAIMNECETASLREAMSYSLFAGGKRLRPRLLLAACETVAGSYDIPPAHAKAAGEWANTALDFACAVEMIHTYSLIHDDLPAMDNDGLRRGKPTSHIKFGQAMAILAGDALLHHAFEVMARTDANAAMCVIARAAGVNGMVAGQVADMAWENKPADEEVLRYIHSRKTGALITACMEAGAILGGASPGTVEHYKGIGEKLGLAFQIRDDILDVTATEDELGKPQGSDEKNHKNTYVTVLGLKKAREQFAGLSKEISDQVSDQVNAAPLREIIYGVLKL